MIEPNGIRVALRVHLSPETGYGNDGVMIARWLARSGFDVRLHPLSCTSGLPADVAAMLIQRPAERYDVELVYAPTSDLAMPVGDDRVFLRPLADRRVLWTMHEQHPVTELDLLAWVDDAAYRYEDLTEVWVPSATNRDAWSGVCDVPVQVRCTGVDADVYAPPAEPRTWSGPLRFLMHGQLASKRKDPWLFLQAWDEARARLPEGSTLTLSTTGIGLHPAIADRWPGVVVLPGYKTPERVIELYHAHHVLVSTSHGEGINKPALEAQATGSLVMATRWAGHEAWWHPDVFTFDHELAPVPGRADAVEAPPVLSSIVEQLDVLAATSPGDRRRRSDRGAGYISSAFSWEHVAAAMDRDLHRIVTGG